MVNRNSLEIPTIVYQMCSRGALICGSFAKALVGDVDTFSDYDLIVPYDKWESVSPLIPKDTAKFNAFGGVRFTDSKGNEIDVWQGDPFTYLYQCYSRRGGNDYVIDLIERKVFTCTRGLRGEQMTEQEKAYAKILNSEKKTIASAIEAINKSEVIKNNVQKRAASQDESSEDVHQTGG